MKGMVATALVASLLVTSGAAGAPIKTRCEAVGLSAKDGRIDVAIADVTFDPATLKPDPSDYELV